MVSARVTPKQRRPYLKKPAEFDYWKKSAVWTGKGKEVYNYASPFTRRLWYYVRSMGHIQHPPGWTCEHHGQDGFVLHVVQSGEVWHDIKQRRHNLGRGQACLVDLRQDVAYGVGGARKAEIYWAWINGKDLPTVFLELGADQDPVFPLPDLPRAEALLRELQTLTLREPTAYEIRSSGVITMILAELFASRADRLNLFSLGEAPRPLSEPIRKAIDYMTRKYDEETSVKHIAGNVVELTMSHFSRLFHHEVGMSPIAYLNQFRIEQAKKSLAHSNESVAEIARSVGFRNQTYFTRTFVRLVGVTPLEYRRKPVKARKP